MPKSSGYYWRWLGTKLNTQSQLIHRSEKRTFPYSHRIKTTCQQKRQMSAKRQGGERRRALVQQEWWWPGRHMNIKDGSHVIWTHVDHYLYLSSGNAVRMVSTFMICVSTHFCGPGYGWVSVVIKSVQSGTRTKWFWGGPDNFQKNRWGSATFQRW